MVKQCIVPGCKKESFRDCGITFFHFPKDEPMRQLWIDAVGRVTKYSVVCHLHFKPEDIISITSKPRLSPIAVPSIFPNMKIQDSETNSCLKDPVLEMKPLNVPSISRERRCKTIGSGSDTPDKKVQTLRRQVKILRQRLRRRDERVKEVKNVIKMIKNKCSTFDDVKEVLRNNLIDKQETNKQIETKGDKSVNITLLLNKNLDVTRL